jgi:hypothetical chaperone protein
VQSEELVLVADIGGGTSDFSVIRVGPQRRERTDRSGDVLANAGVRVGGTDFDSALSLAAVMPLLGLGTQLVDKNLPMPNALFTSLPPGDDQLRLHLQERARARRAGLARVRTRESGTPSECRAPTARPSPGVRRGGCQDRAERRERCGRASGFLEAGLAITATRGDFDRAIEPGWNGCAGGERLHRAAGLGPAAIDTIFLTGGSSRVPAVRAAIARAARPPVWPAARISCPSRSD